MKLRIVALILFAFIDGSSAGLQRYAVKGRLMCGDAPAAGVKVKLVDIVESSQQSYAVKGQLLCGTKPASDVLVKLVDLELGDADDTLGEKRTNEWGEFSISGRKTDYTELDPVLKIFHDCDDGPVAGLRRVAMDLPKKYIRKDGTAGGGRFQPLDIGVLNLEVRHYKEQRDYINERFL
uniref:Transthyretin-like family protein n=1 Tax=Romanomermis culicivorax TaxID=13658 RepID=A0A915KRV7_ROMCU